MVRLIIPLCSAILVPISLPRHSQAPMLLVPGAARPDPESLHCRHWAWPPVKVPRVLPVMVLPSDEMVPV